MSASALALAIALPASAEVQPQGRGNGHGQHAERGNQGGGERARGNQGNQGRGNERRGERADNRGGGNPGRERRAARQEQRGPQRGDNPGRMRPVERGGPEMATIPGRGREQNRGNNSRGNDESGNTNRGNRGNDDRPRFDDRGGERFAGPRRERNGPRLTQRRAVRLDGGEIARLRWQPERSIMRGCPPGLARKHNGCMPPGQARQRAEAQQRWYRNWWAYPAAADYIYDEGYLYRLGGDGRIGSYVPLVGGSLWPGVSWPGDYEAYPVDPYLVDYYGLDEGSDYRFADGAIFGVDPGNQIIQTLVALIAGDDWAVGQRMPDGYGLYNLPYEYRDQYADSDEAMYRYSDGYVYQVDPTTRLVEAVIQLIS